MVMVSIGMIPIVSERTTFSILHKREQYGLLRIDSEKRVDLLILVFLQSGLALIINLTPSWITVMILKIHPKMTVKHLSLASNGEIRLKVDFLFFFVHSYVQLL